MSKLTLWPMPGGISPEENKAQSLTRPIQSSPLPKHLQIQVSQPDRQKLPVILVKIGDKVLKGQVIAKGNDAHGLAFHAPSSGVISSIAPRSVPNSSAIEELCIGIDTDGEDLWIPHQGVPDYQNSSSQELLEFITAAGISGLGGAGFPTYSKLCTQGIHTLIINACECEPFITADEALLRERSADIITGIQIVLHILQAPSYSYPSSNPASSSSLPANLPSQSLRCLVGIESNKSAALNAFVAANNDARIEVAKIPPKYPVGAQKQLIQILTGTEIPSARHAVEKGIVCLNVGTIYAIFRAVTRGEPLISRITTMTGAALAQPCNMEVLIGSPINQLLDICGLHKEQLSQLIMGGPLMGIRLPLLDLPILKTSNCLLATTATELPEPPPDQACIRCGLCTDVCPVSLLPQQLYWFTQGREYDKALAHNLMDCIECGACAYVCPSHIPLVQYYRASKADIRKDQAQLWRAEKSQQRFEYQQQRNQKNKAEADQRRQERAELAQQKLEDGKSSKAQDAIQAALARVKARIAVNDKAAVKTEAKKSIQLGSNEDE